jgi:hypothetical protein
VRGCKENKSPSTAKELLLYELMDLQQCKIYFLNGVYDEKVVALLLSAIICVEWQ